MTLDITKFISNSIKMQAKIQHLDINTKTINKDSLPESISKIISSSYGKKYVLDADYISFFWGAIDKDTIKKLFNVVDKALGKSANRLTDTDFKKINIGKSDSADDPEDENDEGEDDVEERIEDDVEEIVNGNEQDESFDAEEEIEDDEDDKKLDEDDEDIKIEDEVKAEIEDDSSKPTSYFFLKITLK